MPDPESVAKDETLKPRRRSIHPSVWLAALPLMAVLVVLNWRGDVVWTVPEAFRTLLPPAVRIPVPPRHSMHGWPVVFVDRLGDELSAWNLVSDVARFRPLALVLDVAVAAAILFAFLAALEYRHRRRGSLLRFTMLDLVVAVALFAVGLAWFKYHDYRAAREREIIAALDERGCFVSTECRVPLRLTPLFGRNIDAFDRAIHVSFEELTDDKLLAEIANDLSRLPDIESVNFFGQRSVTDVGLECVIRARPLRAINLVSSGVTGSALNSLPEDCLEELLCHNSPFNDDGLASLSRQTRLKYLAVPWTYVSDEGIRHLRQLRSLKELALYSTDVSEDVVDDLGQIPSLTSIELPRKFSDEAIGRLQQMLPDAFIERAGPPDDWWK